MKCSVTFRHMKPSQPIREFVEDKVSKVDKLLDTGCEMHVVLSVENKRFHVAHIDLLTAGAHRVLAEERGEDMYGCIEAAVEKIVRQLKRYQDKTRGKQNASKGRALARRVLKVERADGADVFANTPQVVRQEVLFAQEMSVDDALLQMDLLDSNFLLFTDAISHQLHVMYRLPDGHYGLIEAHARA